MTYLHPQARFTSLINEDNVATANDNEHQLAFHYPFAVTPTPFHSDLHY